MEDMMDEQGIDVHVEVDISEMKTAPYHGIPTIQIAGCAVCNHICAEGGFAVTLPPPVGLDSGLTTHGKFINALQKRPFLGVTICVHGNRMQVTRNRDTLAFLITLISDQDRKDFSWAREIVRNAEDVLGTFSA